MAECKILQLSFNGYEEVPISVHKEDYAVNVFEQYGYENALNKYLSAGWKIAGITYGNNQLIVALQR